MSRFLRRDIIKLSAVLGVSATLPLNVSATTSAMQDAMTELFGKLPETSDQIQIEIPPISENGYSVLVDIMVDSPMTDTDYVKRIALFSERNPVPLLAVYTLSPRSGRAHITNRVRLGGTQSVHGIAEMSDGRLITASAKTLVTLAACVVL